MSEETPRIVEIQGGQMTGYHVCECGANYVKDKWGALNAEQRDEVAQDVASKAVARIERRRYALLQAAAMILSMHTGETYSAVVDAAEKMLAEIERREK